MGDMGSFWLWQNWGVRIEAAPEELCFFPELTVPRPWQMQECSLHVPRFFQLKPEIQNCP